MNISYVSTPTIGPSIRMHPSIGTTYGIDEAKDKKRPFVDPLREGY